MAEWTPAGTEEWASHAASGRGLSTRIDTASNGVDPFRGERAGGRSREGVAEWRSGEAWEGWGMEWHGICWMSSDVPPGETAGARIGTAEAAGGRTPWNQCEGGREACICRWWFRFCGGGGGGGPACEGGRTRRRGKPLEDTPGPGSSAWATGNAQQRRARETIYYPSLVTRHSSLRHPVTSPLRHLKNGKPMANHRTPLDKPSPRISLCRIYQIEDRLLEPAETAQRKKAGLW
jgi:hypothetical protein